MQVQLKPRLAVLLLSAIYHSPQKNLCCPQLFRINTYSKTKQHGCQHKENTYELIKAYESEMKCTHANFQLTGCGLLINEQYSFLYLTPDILTSCDCFGLGCVAVKCVSVRTVAL